MKEHDEGLVQSVNDQAAEWFIRLRDRDLTASDRRKFVRWLKQSPGHIAEFMRLCQLYGRVKRAKVPTPAPEEAESNVVALKQWEPAPRSQEEPRPRFSGSLGVRFAVAACGLAFLAVIAHFVLASNTVETHAGEWRTVQLADGSVVSAGPETLVQVDYSKDARRIHLAHGEAMFKVTKDASRPFIVNAGSAVARAVGTRFGVARHDGHVRVTVAEGKVAVVRSEQAAALEHAVDLSVATALVADDSVEIRADAPAVPLHVEKINSSLALAWASGQVSLGGPQGASVGEAVAEFNRRNRVQILIDDPAVANAHVCCRFDVADPQAFAEFVASSSADIELLREGPNVLRIVQRRAGQAEPPDATDAR